MAPDTTTYWDYLAIEDLLALQGGVDGDDRALTSDELMFIVIHQVDELWFKLAIRELAQVRDLFHASPVPETALGPAVRRLRRVAAIFRLAAQHFELMETLTTRDYLEFRDKLSPASGFQSAQMREIEILLGLADEERVSLGDAVGQAYLDALKNADGSESPALARVRARQADRPTLREALDEWLYRTPILGSSPGEPGDDDAVRRFVAAYCEAHAEETRAAMSGVRAGARDEADRARIDARREREIAGVRAFLQADDRPEAERARARRIRAALVFIESYRDQPLLAWPREVLEAIVALEQALLIFRQRHARMVERIIGRRMGTGGSAGVDYLDKTALQYRIFRNVWEVRTLLLRTGALPPLEGEAFYGFAHG